MELDNQMMPNTEQQVIQQGQQPVDMNVQMNTGELIDEGVTGTNPVSNIGNLSEARNAFANMFSDDASGVVQNTSASEPLTSVPNNASATLNTELPDISSVLSNQTTEPQNTNVIMPDISQIVREAVAQGMKDGRLPDMSVEMTANELTPEVNAQPEYDSKFEMPDFESDEFYAQFTDNPGKTMADLAQRAADQREQALLQRLKPLLDQSEKMMANQRIQDAINQFAQNGITDLGDYKDDMIRIIRENNYPTDDALSYELSYGKAKSNRLEQLNRQLKETQGRTLADYMNDNDSVSQMAQNDNVKRMVIQEYLAGLSNGSKPQVISDGAGIAPSAIQPTKATNFKEASNMFRKIF